MSMAIKRASYTGDPGLFGDIFRGIGGAVGGLLTGGAVGRAPGRDRRVSSREATAYPDGRTRIGSDRGNGRSRENLRGKWGDRHQGAGGNRVPEGGRSTAFDPF